ncbi:MAG: BrnT family toxin [Proteobacteria bacterium]|nr:BrnT family toxin [Pseudomonadota bacterium]
MVLFEWDPVKSETNRLKHGITFEASREIWNDPEMVEISSRRELEIERHYLVIGKIRSKTWTAVITGRGDHVRLISVQRSRKSEENLYGS